MTWYVRVQYVVCTGMAWYSTEYTTNPRFARGRVFKKLTTNNTTVVTVTDEKTKTLLARSSVQNSSQRTYNIKLCTVVHTPKDHTQGYNHYSYVQDIYANS